MNQVMTDLWPYLIPPTIAAIVWLFREIYRIKTKVAVMEQEIKSLQSTMKSDIESIQKTMKSYIENIQKTIESINSRLDSHSRKQDAIPERISSMEKELLKQMNDMAVNISGLASDLRGLSNMLSISDYGIKVDKRQ